MTQEAIEDKPLSHKQRNFARELGIAIASGGRDADLVRAYEAAGYAPDRGNARRLAADPRIKAIADETCAEALRLAGLHIGYLQAKALELLHASPTRIFRSIKIHQAAQQMLGRNSAEMERLDAALDEITWPLTEFKIDKDGIIAIKLPDKKAIIEMLAKQLGAGKEENTTTVAVTLEQLVAQSMTPKENAV